MWYLFLISLMNNQRNLFIWWFYITFILFVFVCDIIIWFEVDLDYKFYRGTICCQKVGIFQKYYADSFLKLFTTLVISYLIKYMIIKILFLFRGNFIKGFDEELQPKLTPVESIISFSELINIYIYIILFLQQRRYIHDANRI